MPRRSKGPRLWLQPARGRDDGSTEAAVWVIRDGSVKRSTGAGAGDIKTAEIALGEYIVGKSKAPRERNRDPATIKVADVIAIYADDVAGKHARPHETAARLDRILDHFGLHKTLADMNRQTCEEYARKRGHDAAARRELEDLRAAIRHHWQEGLCATLTPVILPERGEARATWLTRPQAAKLLWAAWRLRQKYKGNETARWTARHVARFILVALYTGTRAGAVCGAALEPTEGRGWIDVENGVFYRRALGKKKTKKRQPFIRLPPRLLVHLRRWHRLGIAKKAVVEWNGKPVKKINKGFRSVRSAAGFEANVVPHVLRHTAVTWQAQLGVPTHEILGFFGITMEVFEEVYAHHHPDHQSSAVNAFSRSPTFTDRIGVNKTAQTAPNVLELNRGRG